MKELLKISLRQRAIYLPEARSDVKHLSRTAAILVTNLANAGYGVSPELLEAINAAPPAQHWTIQETFAEVMGFKKNWTPLVKGWDIPTGETIGDHMITMFANRFYKEGHRLPCGHIIPPNTFPLERYNGCPYCGTPFQAANFEISGQGSRLKTLVLWRLDEVQVHMTNLLASNSALDATQISSLKAMLSIIPLPENIKVPMKETAMLVTDILVSNGNFAGAQVLFTSPADILRYLWFKHTGFLQLLRPDVVIRKRVRNNGYAGQDQRIITEVKAKEELRLKYTRKDCVMVATWLNNLDMDIQQMCESMHAKRSMWVRFIRALRLSEYSKRSGFHKLKELLDYFYNGVYDVWQGQVQHYRLRLDAEKTLQLLQQRPGLFARSLFANILWFGPEAVAPAFANIIHKVPVRLMLTLRMYADTYFDAGSFRYIKPLGGNGKTIPANRLLWSYTEAQLDEMKNAVKKLCTQALITHFAATAQEHKTIYIAPRLFAMPVPIGDRSNTVQDIPAALQGTRFPVEGDKVRLFMQWGNGLNAQHLDTDLSCAIIYANHTNICNYHTLAPIGAYHSGDIRRIPNLIGTAEYIEIDVKLLNQLKAQYVVFTCNAYTAGALSPNMVVGWMDSKHPMTVSETTGVAYDPSCVQHQVRIESSLTKGLVFGVLDVGKREIIWLEMPFGGQTIAEMDVKAVQAYIKKLNSKMSIGELLMLKAGAQHLSVIDTPNADENYNYSWAIDSAGVTKLFTA